MIETNKRKPPKQTLIDIYNALGSLTNGEISSMYTLDQFLKEPYEAASEYIENQLNVETIENHYNELMNLAHKYELSEYIIKIGCLLGQYYFMINEYEKTCNHFLTVIKQAVDSNLNPYLLYHQYGIILRGMGRYAEALSTLSLAVGCAQNKVEKDDSKIHLMVTYYRMEQYPILSKMITSIEKEKESYLIEHYIGAMIIKEGVLRRNGQLLEARECLLPFVEKEEYEQYFNFIYHYLGWNYVESSEYDEALKMFKRALPYRKSNLQKALTNLLIGYAYFEMDNYEQAQLYYTKVKSTILSSSSTSSKRMWFDMQLDLYWHTKQTDKITSLRKELSIMVENGELQNDIAHQITAGLFKQIANHISVMEGQYSFLSDLLSL